MNPNRIGLRLMLPGTGCILSTHFLCYTTSMRRFLLPGLLGILLGFLLVPTAHGADPAWCLISNLPAPGCPGGGAFAGLSIFQLIQKTFIQFLRYAVVAIAFGMFVYYAFALLFMSDDENAVTQMKTSFSYAIIGCAIISIATLMSDALTPTLITPTNPLTLTDATGNIIKTQLKNIITYIKLLIGALVSFHVTYQGIRLIALLIPDFRAIHAEGPGRPQGLRAALHPHL
ncbi:hypothetical protein HYT95_02270, partial [Candidatus Peregrinibacteria bacterium]|nr:hypothetical protein [Candidatus Peregrinibacteria bacterium]